MGKQEFLDALRAGLAGLPQEDIEERISFYAEMIDDRMEEGLTEEEAVAQIGSVEEITQQIVAETPLTRLVKERVKPKRRLQVWEIILLVVGSPVWFSLLIALLSVLFSVYVVLWSLILSLWAVELSFALSAVACIPAGIYLIFTGQVPTGLALIGAGVALAGLSIALFFVCRAATHGGMKLTAKIALWIKSLVIKKENEI